MSRSTRRIWGPRLAMKHKGVYLTRKEAKIISDKGPSLGSIRQLSKEEQKVFRKIENKIKNPDIMKRADHGEKLSSDKVWLSPSQAKLLIAWKEAALEGKVSKKGVKDGLAAVPRELIAKKWETLFKEKIDLSVIAAMTNILKRYKKINLAQVNVGVVRTRREVYLTKKDKELIKLRTVDKLTYEKIAGRLGVSLGGIENRVNSLRKLGYEL